eukprot:364260-Chlamydomonas_euryale.AAC.3
MHVPPACLPACRGAQCAELASLDNDVNVVLLELHSALRTYGIVKLSMDARSVSDGSPRVARVTERMQLGPADACLLTMLYPEDAAAAGQEKEHAGNVALQLASTWHFPREAVRAQPLTVRIRAVPGGSGRGQSGRRPPPPKKKRTGGPGAGGSGGCECVQAAGPPRHVYMGPCLSRNGGRVCMPGSSEQNRQN